MSDADALRAEIRAVLLEFGQLKTQTTALEALEKIDSLTESGSKLPLSAANVVRTIAGMFSSTNRQHMAEWLVDCADAIERGVPWPKLKPKPVPLPDSETERRAEFGPQHIQALTWARARVVKAATNFSDAHHRYTEKGLTETAAEMMACNTACFEVSKHLKDLINAIRARAEREANRGG